MMESELEQEEKKEQEKTVCNVCHKEAISVKPVELLPGGGVILRALHQDNVTHSWEEYASVSSLLCEVKGQKKKDRLYAICPRCGKKGRVNTYRSYTDTYKISGIKYGLHYIMIHEKTGGYWGKDQHVPKRRRCFIHKQEDRDAILKQIGRFIQS